ncbi:MAG: glycosyltransferase family 87 protein [Terriglobales bacterium]
MSEAGGGHADRAAWLVIALLALAAALQALLRPHKAIDFRVYFENARHYFGAGAAMYGPASGTGWAGGVYRYPPVFLDLFRPLAALPLALGAALWAAGKLLLGGGLVLRLRRRWQLASAARFWPALLLIAAYFVQEVRGGNAQFYIVALAMLAFLSLQRPRVGGFWLGWASALKLWPLFFLPCLLACRRWRIVFSAGAAFVAWTLLPVLWRGWDAQWRLFAQWLAQERGIAALNARVGEIWYPGQSLHDVMMRYLTVLDYSQTPDARYAQVAWAHLATASVERLWWVAVAVLLVGLLVWLYAAREQPDAASALMFCAVVVIEPHVHRIILVTLLWPALWLAAAWTRGQLRNGRAALFWLAVVVSAAEPLVPGAARQRLLQVYGTDFWLVVLPLTAAVAWQGLRDIADGNTADGSAH